VLIRELMRCEYVDSRENLLLVGNPGTGKSLWVPRTSSCGCRECRPRTSRCQFVFVDEATELVGSS
jgi:hypothetical protein